MTQLQQWIVHDKEGYWLGTFPHQVLADIYASALTAITRKEYTTVKAESPEQNIVRFFKETAINQGGKS